MRGSFVQMCLHQIMCCYTVMFDGSFVGVSAQEHPACIVTGPSWCTQPAIGLHVTVCVCPVAGLVAAGARSLVTGRAYAVDSKHRSTDEMHKYLDSLFCLKDKVALVTGMQNVASWREVQLCVSLLCSICQDFIQGNAYDN